MFPELCHHRVGFGWSAVDVYLGDEYLLRLLFGRGEG
jgi:hypothetical protein